MKKNKNPIEGGYAVPKNLGELRAQFDGVRDIASTVKDESVKTKLLNELEKFYVSTASWFGIGATGTEAHAGA